MYESMKIHARAISNSWANSGRPPRLQRILCVFGDVYDVRGLGTRSALRTFRQSRVVSRTALTIMENSLR